MKITGKKWVALLLALSMTALTACGSGEKTVTAQSTGQGSTDPNCKYDTFITIDLFCSQSNFQGIQSGWFAEYVKQKFNMELNIIAPNVAGGGDTLFQTRSAAGDLGDIVIAGTANGRLQDMVTAGLIQDMTPYMAGMENLNACMDAIETINSSLVKEDGIWAIPSDISFQTADTPSEGMEPTFGTYLQWDVYKEIGRPKIKDLDDLLQVLKQMQDAHPTTEDGKPVYAISLFKDWDASMMNNAKIIPCFYGYDEMGFVLAKADGSDYESVIDPDSMYSKALGFFYKANQMGLVDPESTTQNYDTIFTKYKQGQVLLSLWPWLGQSAYNTKERTDAGKGFMYVPVEDMKIFSYGCYSRGDARTVAMIGSKAEDPQRMADFIDWMYSPEGISLIQAGINGSAGPEGLTWEQGADGAPYLTDFGKEAFFQGDAQVPEEWGGGSWKNGISQLGYRTLHLTDTDPRTNEPYQYELWDSVREELDTVTSREWREVYGVKDTMEYLKENQMLLVAPGSPYVQPEEDSEITALRNQCKSTIIDYSWQMVYAEDQETFDKLQKLMYDTAMGLGYDQVYAVDMKNAKDQQTAREEALKAGTVK